MPRKKEKKNIVIFPVVKKQPGVFIIYIEKEGTLKEVASGLSAEAFLDLYFTNLTKNITLETTKEEVISKYNEIWNKKGIRVVYIDSWGHRWNNQMPSKQKFDNYLNNFIKYGIKEE